jgi:HAD superfamily hydrolase (TIGR01509 family)
VDAILFDWDGTLVDSLESFYAANAAVLAEEGVAFDRTRYREAYSPDPRIFYRRLGIPEERHHHVLEAWRRAFVPAARPLPGVREALGRLHASGERLGLVTATIRAVVEPQVREQGLQPLLEVLVCGDDLAEVKPDPAPLRLALRQLGLDAHPERAVYVGDAPDDMRMARSAGTGAVGIESMLGERVALLAAGAGSVHPSVAAWVDALPAGTVAGS